MQLTKFSDYALRVLMYLAQREGENVAIAEIARAHAVSESHLMKVVNRLARRGYLTTLRGKGSGIELGRPANAISIGGVVRDLEPMVAIECLAANYDGACFLAPRCGVKRIMSHAQEAFPIALDEHTLAEVSGLRRTP